MVERIRQLLEARQLTPTQFADAIGVARPIISHILSGRNKPSLEVVQKIIGAFPDLSLPWLLSGAGTMLASAIPPDVKVSPKAPTSPTSSDNLSGGATNARQASQDRPAALRAPETPSAPLFEQSKRQVEPAPTPKPANPIENSEQVPPAPPLVPRALAPSTSNNDSVATSAAPALEIAQQVQPARTVAPIPPAAATAFAEPDKAIRRIVIFYQDGTFTDYRPEAN
ncbi:helix-turn-helix domain-containing protein [Hymenobacter sp. GOD-10R]|uniref:helix-turn-helix domain-containing protein n=1 Tax=Hymenobacter sp. GOD-10R TaxID=3093922 RepID=UPI002D7955D4|nr:helix-turn-helix domain-containing protein [Hymenobacter sp. GOD-10R]WRQ30906.1 helix-turn-helix domain-containing protein [Hymenobacter sp. GOD-10R]